jgi:proline iminopeptidase
LSSIRHVAAGDGRINRPGGAECRSLPRAARGSLVKSPPPMDSLLQRPLSPFDSRLIEAGEHLVYVEQVGNPEGLPAVFLHGGPGSGCNADQRRYFDPHLFRAVLFDQRGSGRSTPKRETENNTTAGLIADMERIRILLGIERWMVVGGSWGATLAVAYAEAHPERVMGLVLRAVFLGTREEFKWAFEGAAQTFYPELWRSLVNLLPESERGDPIAALGARITNPDPKIHGAAAHVWHDYERALSLLRPHSLALPPSLDAGGGEPPNTPFLEWHYLRHDCFLEPWQLLRDAPKLRGIPGIVVQGRYDLLCPPQAAHDLVAAWGNAELRFVPAGHSVAEPPVLDAVLAAIRDMGIRLAGK